MTTFADMTGAEFKHFILAVSEPLPEDLERQAATAADVLLAAGEPAADPVTGPYLRAALTPAGLGPAVEMQFIWHVSNHLLRSSLAVSHHGVSDDLVAAEARQRLAVADLDRVGMEAALAAEADRIRIARGEGRCIELECRAAPTDCEDLCCWHCGRGHRAAFTAAQAETDE